MTHITKDNLENYAFVNLDTLTYPVKAVCVCFHGFTDDTVYEKSPRQASELGSKGIAWVYPYFSVWAWYSDNSRKFNEQVLDAVYGKLNLSDDIPLIISGGSMGGMTAFMYCIDGKRKPKACAMNCPVTNVRAHFENNFYIRRAIMDAHIDKETDMLAFTESISPVYRIADFPDIPVFSLFGGKDSCITEKEYIPFIEKMKIKNMETVISEEMEHCGTDNDEKGYRAMTDFIINAALKRR